jgi:hypothetical protein
MAKKKKEQDVTSAPANAEMENTAPAGILQSIDIKEYSDDFLKSEQERYNNLANEFGNVLKTKSYAVKVDTIKDAKDLLKHLEKNVKWNHSDAPVFIAAYQKLKDAIAKGLNDANELMVEGPALNGIYQILIKTEGTGYFEVRDYMSLLANVGQGLSDGMKALIEDQNELRNIHTNLNALDNETVARQAGIQVEELEQA